MSQNRATVTPITDRSAWDRTVESLAGHPLQLWGWGATKSRGAWQASHYRVDAADGTPIGAAQVLVRPLPLPFRALAYAPRGPVAAPGRETEVLAALRDRVAADHHPVVLSIEPDVDADSDAERGLLAAGRVVRGASPILIPSTLIFDLTRTEDELLADATKKTRQYIRKSGREDLVFRAITAAELDPCLAVYRQTAERAGFGLHTDDYYRSLYQDQGESAAVFAAFHGDTVVAFLWLAVSGTTAFELYGGMNDEGQRTRANYALKWHAITAMRERGVTRYDTYGLLNDGVSQFKEGFAHHRDTLTGTWDLPLSPWYPVYARALPLARTVAKRARPAAKAALTRAVPAARRVVGGAVPAVRSFVSAVRSRGSRTGQ